MFNVLDTALKGILESADAPVLVRDADISFDRPSDTFNQDKTTIGLFLYDIRENTELRSSEPFINRNNGVATINKPPIRLACSYLVTAWIESGITGEEAILKQHALLGAVLKVFAGMPTIPASFMQGELASQPYPIPLVTLQGDLTRNPAEFWSALGGKLRPSFTLTATIALDQDATPTRAHVVSTKKMVVRENTLGIEESLFQIAGVVRDDVTKQEIEGAEVTLSEYGMKMLTTTAGQFWFSLPIAGNVKITARKSTYSDFTKTVSVPGNTTDDFDIYLKL